MILFDNFTDTVFLKEDSDLNKKLDALEKLIREYPNNSKLREEFYMVNKGLTGEKEIIYQLKNANLGLIVLHDVNIAYDDLKAQIDFIVITKSYCYFIECKNLIGNITIDNNDDFIREYMFNNKKIKTGMYSPLRQVENQRDIYKKIWDNNLSKNKIINYLKKSIYNNSFYDIHRCLVVAANNETILNTAYASKNIKYKVLKADSLIRKLNYDLEHSDKSLWESKKGMEEWGQSFLNICINQNINYYDYYLDKYDLKCPNCGSNLKERKGPYSTFLGCSNYPKCKYTRNIEEV